MRCPSLSQGRPTRSARVEPAQSVSETFSVRRTKNKSISCKWTAERSESAANKGGNGRETKAARDADGG
eukprot:6182592-Pleurochrysis_carterae.AAC.2